ncbi:MAG: hypothetical protein K0V04_35545 [Deltaproteobacteria bacterium]|nr:hypothetical protein [Deltaproteobacteria bacterium]
MLAAVITVRPAVYRGAAIVGLTAMGCVNNYVVDEPNGGGSGSSSSNEVPPVVSGEGTSSAGSTGVSGSSSRGASGSGGSTSGGSTDSSMPTQEGTGPDSTDGADPLELCQPCEADAQCGGRSDVCALVGGQQVCLRVCMEGRRMCASGLVCMPVMSVDGAMIDQCVPESGMCPLNAAGMRVGRM